MNFAIGDILQAWNQLTTSMSAGRAMGANTIDYSFITPTIIALGDVPDSKIDELKQIIQGDPAVIWNLGSKPLSPIVRAAVTNQIIDAHWRTPCQYTRAPMLETVFALCESIKSWYDLNEKNLAVIHCPPGHPYTGIIIACLLKYIGAFEHAAHAYDFYCSKRLASDSASHSLASSYRNLFINVDKTVDNNGYINMNPCRLKTITIAGLPVDDIPCVEVWDINGVIFSSHIGQKPANTCTWNDEYADGFYKVEKDVIGDFSVICRFGGHLATTKDKSTLIFKYQNTTAFLACEVVELKHSDVDINPQYQESLDIELFKVHLMFDISDNIVPSTAAGMVTRLPPFPRLGLPAFRAGLDEITKMHSVIPEPKKCGDLVKKGCQDDFVPVSLQLSNNSAEDALILIDLIKQRMIELSETPRMSRNISPITAPPLEEIAEEDIDANWEVVDFRCRKCKDDCANKADQVIVCTCCNSNFHTMCVGLRRIPFGNKNEKDQTSREKYIKTHFGDWKCSYCIAKSNAKEGGIVESVAEERVEVDGIAPPAQIGGRIIVTDQVRTSSSTAATMQTPVAVRSGGTLNGSALSNDDEEDHPMRHLSSPNIRSRQDLVAILVAALASAGVGIEELMKMPEAKQKEKLMGVITSKYPEFATDGFIKDQKGNLDLVTALSSIINHANEQGMNASKTKEFVVQPATPFKSDPYSAAGSAFGAPAETPLGKRVAKSEPENGEKFDARAQLLANITKKARGGKAPTAGSVDNNPAALAAAFEQQGMYNPGMQPGSFANQNGGMASMAGSFMGQPGMMSGTIMGGMQGMNGMVGMAGMNGMMPGMNGMQGMPVGGGYSMMNGMVAMPGMNGVAGGPGMMGMQYNGQPGGLQGFQGSFRGVPYDPNAPMSENGMPMGVGPVMNNGGEEGPERYGPAVKDIPEYTKYFKMIKAGIPKAAVADKLVSDGVIESKDLASSFVNLQEDQSIPPELANKMKVLVTMATHPRYEKFFNMLKMGISKDLVKSRMEEEGVDSEALEKPNEKVELYDSKSKLGMDGNETEEKMVPANEHPKYAKFFKMLKVGTPKEAVKMKMQQEGLDPAVIDLEPTQMIPEKEKPKDEEGEKVPVGKHPKYEKFFKMIKMGIPPDAVKLKMKNEGLNPDMLDKDPETMVPLEDKKKEEDEGEKVPISEHPKYAKFFKMLKVGTPKPAVQIKMQQEGLDPTMLDKDPTELIPLEEKKAGGGSKVKLCEHPKYAKFFKMLKVGMPKPAVQIKMKAEGMDPSMLDRDPEEMVPLEEEAEVQKVKACEHPVYAKFFKMLKFGTPKEAVKLKMQQEGANPDILDRNPEEMIPLDEKKAGAGGKAEAADKPKLRKKKLHWKALDGAKLQNSLWADDSDLEIDLDEEEFNKLFVESSADDTKKPEKAKEPKKQKVILIDMKRAQNGGIALARIKFKFEELRDKIKNMDDHGLTTDQMKSIEEFLPQAQELTVLKNYKGDFELLGITEKFMLTFMTSKGTVERIRCMIFKQQFKGRYTECSEKLKKVEQACDDVKMSGKLKKVLKTILKVGNQLNEGEDHKGFSVDSLLKLGTAKAFDKKTSVLQYVVKLIARNDDEALKFPEELKNIAEASRFGLDGIIGDKNTLVDEFNNNFKVVDKIREQDSESNTESMLDFFTKADEHCRKLERNSEKVREKFNKVLEYFGEDANMSSVDFFSTLNKFVKEFILVREQVERDRKAELKRQLEANTPTPSRRHSTISRPPSDTDLAGAAVSQKASVSHEAKSALKENKVEDNAPTPPVADRNALLQDLLSKRNGGNQSRRKSAMI